MRALALLLALAACSTPPGPDPAALTRQLEMMREANASSEALCAKAREIADAWLIREDDHRYRLANVQAGVACLRVELERL